MSEPMSDERLDEIVTQADVGSFEGDVKAIYDACCHDIPALVAEIRRLRLENHLLRMWNDANLAKVGRD